MLLGSKEYTWENSTCVLNIITKVLLLTGPDFQLTDQLYTTQKQ